MATAKVAITIEKSTLIELDKLVDDNVFPNRSRAIQEAVAEKLQRLRRSRLARECSKLDPELEKAMAEEGMGEEIEQWPVY